MQNRKLLLKMTISNLEKTWTNTAMFEFSLAKPDIRQLPWQKLKFSNDFLFLVSPSPSSRPFHRMGKNKLKKCTSHLYFIFSIILKSTQLCPVLQHDLRSWWQQHLGKSWDLKDQGREMNHISGKTKSHGQNVLFLWPIKLTLWIITCSRT